MHTADHQALSRRACETIVTVITVSAPLSMRWRARGGTRFSWRRIDAWRELAS